MQICGAHRAEFRGRKGKLRGAAQLISKINPHSPGCCHKEEFEFLCAAFSPCHHLGSSRHRSRDSDRQQSPGKNHHIQQPCKTFSVPQSREFVPCLHLFLFSEQLHALPFSIPQAETTRDGWQISNPNFRLQTAPLSIFHTPRGRKSNSPAFPQTQAPQGPEPNGIFFPQKNSKLITHHRKPSLSKTLLHFTLCKQWEGKCFPLHFLQLLSLSTGPPTNFLNPKQDSEFQPGILNEHNWVMSLT